MYILKTYDRLKLELTDEEAAQILTVINAGQQKNVLVKGNYFAIAGIASLTKQEDFEEEGHTIGVLHDGTRVVKQFGEWFCMTGERDENGRYAVRPDSAFYPEIMMDCVPSVETYERKYAGLPLEQRKALMIEGKDPERYRRSGGLSRIGTGYPVPEAMKQIASVTGIAGYCDEHDAFIVDCPCGQKVEENAEKLED